MDLFSAPDIPTPIVPEPTIMPVPDDEAMRKAKKKSIAEQRRRGGRESTILTDKLGA